MAGGLQSEHIFVEPVWGICSEVGKEYVGVDVGAVRGLLCARAHGHVGDGGDVGVGLWGV